MLPSFGLAVTVAVDLKFFMKRVALRIGILISISPLIYILVCVCVCVCFYSGDAATSLRANECMHRYELSKGKTKQNMKKVATNKHTHTHMENEEEKK